MLKDFDKMFLVLPEQLSHNQNRVENVQKIEKPGMKTFTAW